MKRIIFTPSTFFTFLCRLSFVLPFLYAGNSNSQSANTALSNLSATSVNQSLLPVTDNKTDLGGISKAWRNIYLGNSLYLKGGIALHSPGTGNFFVGNNSGNISLTGSCNTGMGQYALTFNTTGFYNTAGGYASLYSNKTGTDNTAYGYASLYLNTGGSFNTAIGRSALYYNTGSYNTATGYGALTNNIGSQNTASGYSSLYSNTSGTGNTASGYQSMYNNKVGIGNTASGYSSLFTNISGGGNTASGWCSLYSNTTGGSNTGNGLYSLYSNLSGNGNTAIGANALYSNTTGYSNVAIGVQSLYYNKTASNIVAVGDSALRVNNAERNTAVGSKALFYNSIGYDNTATGFNALYSNQSGNFNTAYGNASLYDNTQGNENTAVGFAALMFNVWGRGNTAIGSCAGVTSDHLMNTTAIGAYAVVSQDNEVRIGNYSVTSISGQVDWTTFSDGRYKNNIRENVQGLAFINSLRPVTYTLNINALKEYYNKGRKQIIENKDEKNKAETAKSEEAASKIVHNGFIAQEVEEAAKKLGFEFSGVDKPQNENSLYGLRYAEFVVPLVKAVQELSRVNNDKAAQIGELKSQNQAQQKINNAQQKQIDELKGMIQSLQQNFEKCNPCNASAINIQQLTASSSQSSKTIFISGASLEQNIPNPFTHTTTINYTLPATYTAAKIIITDQAGKVLKEVNVSGSGKGSLQINASMFAAGVYSYSLYANGKLIGTKKMIK